MYVLTELRDVIRIPPKLFHLTQEEAIADELNKSLANKVCQLKMLIFRSEFNSCSQFQVIINVGLCICLFDITKIEESFIFQGDGAAHAKSKHIIIDTDLIN